MASNRSNGLEYLFSDIVTKAKAEKLDVESIKHSLRKIYKKPILKHMQYFLANWELPEVQKILDTHKKSLESELAKDFFIVSNNGCAKLLRRPEILKGYTIEGRTYVAITERKLFTVVSGEILEVDIVYIPHLPKPNRLQPFKATCVEWGCSSYKVSEYLEKNFLPRTYKEQIDIFQEEHLNYLIYDDYKLSEVIPESSGKEIIVEKKKVYTDAP